MIEPATIAQIVAADPLAPFQAAIVGRLKTLLTGVHVVAHPGKADVGELVARTIVPAPGISIGWVRMRRTPMQGGGYQLDVEWVAYIVVEPMAIASRRVEAEVLAFTLGSRLLEILDDDEVALWGRRGVLPPADRPGPELKPIFTVKDKDKGTTYYSVTWTQGIADLGKLRLPTAPGEADAEGYIFYEDASVIDDLAPWLAKIEEDDDEE